MKSKQSPLQRINRILDYYAKFGRNSERVNAIKKKIIFAKYGNRKDNLPNN